MNFSRTSNKGILAKAIMFAAAIQAANPALCLAGDDDWTIQMETQELKQQFQYRGTMLPTVAKVNVSYGRNAGDQKMFARLWYYDGKPIGLERLGTFGLTKAEGAIIEVRHKDQAEIQQEKGTANAILRVLLNAYHNSNAIAYIKLPEDSFEEICDELVKLNCVEKNTPVDIASKAKLSLVLEAIGSSKNRQLYYY